MDMVLSPTAAARPTAKMSATDRDPLFGIQREREREERVCEKKRDRDRERYF